MTSKAATVVPRVFLQRVFRRRVHPRVRLHTGLHAFATHVEPRGIGIVDRIRIIPFNPLPARCAGRAAQGTRVGRAAVALHKFITQPRVLFQLPASIRGQGLQRQQLPAHPVRDHFLLRLIAELDPGMQAFVEEEPHILQPFLRERVGKGGDFNDLARFHGC